jgi:hypothetical protein
MLIDDNQKSMLFARANELSFQMACNECAGVKIHAERRPERIAARRDTARAIDVEAMQRLVAHEERAWH